MLQHDTLTVHFETYMRSFHQQHGRFNLNDFADFAITLLNYQVNAQIIPSSEKRDAAYFLVSLYNKGMGNRIVEADLQKIVDLIHQDFSVDMQILQRILG